MLSDEREASAFYALGRHQVLFVDVPLGTVFIPPPGYPVKTVRCRTNATANITWIRDQDGTRLDESLFHITRESDTSSVMHLLYEDVHDNPTVAGVLTAPTNHFHCEANAHWTSANSSSFKFAHGGRMLGLCYLQLPSRLRDV